MSSVREQLYESYASSHAGHSSGKAAGLIYRRDIRPNLPSQARGSRVLDVGCGQGDLVQLMVADGFDARGIDISPEQVAIAHAAGRTQVEHGDLHDYLDASTGSWDAVIATDVLEHLHKDEVIKTFEHVCRALKPGGVFVARVPNAVSPTGGAIMFGDITHETWFTQRSVAQVVAVTGFDSVRSYACPPVAHGLMSAARFMVWKPVSGLLKLALAAETGRARGHIVTQNLTFVARKAAVSNRTPAR